MTAAPWEETRNCRCTLVDTSELTITHLDEDWANPCEIAKNGEPCGRGAEWIAWKSQCCAERENNVLMCTPCRAQITQPAVVLECARCKTIFCPPSTAWALIEPLNRRTQ
jgi:hypothetical protein